MIVLDTNVVSEAMKPDSSSAVMAWLNEQDLNTLYVSSVTLAEELFGINALPVGKRRNLLHAAFLRLLAVFNERILPFDAEAARCYADLELLARQRGRGFPVPDGYIAAIAASRGFIVASRDTAPYEAAGVEVVNPWLVA